MDSESSSKALRVALGKTFAGLVIQGLILGGVGVHFGWGPIVIAATSFLCALVVGSICFFRWIADPLMEHWLSRSRKVS